MASQVYSSNTVWVMLQMHHTKRKNQRLACSLVVECLLTMHEAPGSTFSFINNYNSKPQIPPKAKKNQFSLFFNSNS